MDKYPDVWNGFEWDEGKRKANLEKHGIDFEDVCMAFDGRPRVDGPSVQNAGRSEERHVTIAEIEGVVIAIVWTWRGRVIRLISARVARRGERELYAEKINGKN